MHKDAAVSLGCSKRQHPRSMFHWTILIGSVLPWPLGAELAALKSLDLISPGVGNFISCTEGAVTA